MNIFKNIYLHFKYTRILNRVYRDENILQNMSRLFGVNVRKDYVGRLYAILNPSLIKQEEKVYELLDGGLNDDAFIEKWVMEHLIAMRDFIKANNLFDLLTFQFNRIDEYNNYLMILEPITYKDFMKSLKIGGVLIILLMLITITTIFLI